MSRNLLFILILVFMSLKSFSQIVITEIMYNSPDGDDVYEYLELYNNSGDAINIEGY